MSDGQTTLATLAEKLAHIRALARPYAPKDPLASEQLIAARREETGRSGVQVIPIR